MKTPLHILIVEDERKIAALVRDFMVAAGYRTTEMNRGTGVVEWIQENQPDLVLLDLMLPGKDGLSICREVRALDGPAASVPIVILTARVEEIDRLLGLELGADDYMCKPFSYPELVARVKALLRRVERLGPFADNVNPEPPLLQLNNDALEAHYRGVLLPLTTVEYRLLFALAETPGRVLSRESLLGRLYQDHRVVGDRTIDTHVKNLRRKIVEAGGEEDMVRSIYGVGYKLERWEH